MNTFSLDTFGVPSGGNLTGHTGQLGASWSLVTGTSPVFSAAGWVRPAASGIATAYPSGTGGTADQSVEVLIYPVTLDSHCGVALDLNTGSDNYYFVGYGPTSPGSGSGQIEVYRVSGGTWGSPVATLAVTLTANKPYLLKVDRRSEFEGITGTTLNMFLIDPSTSKYLDGSTAWFDSSRQVGKLGAYTDASPLAAGATGLVVNQVSGTAGDTTGVHAMSWRAGDSGARTANTLFLAENFSSGLSIPWWAQSHGGTVSISAGIGQGGSNALAITGGWAGIESLISDSTNVGGAAGNVAITTTLQLNGASAGGGSGTGVFLQIRCQDSPVQNNAPTNYLMFALGVGFSNGSGLFFYFGYSTNGNSNFVQLSSTYTGASFSNTLWYTVTYSVVDLVMTATVQRSSDNFYATSGGTWQSSPASFTYTIVPSSTVPWIEGPGLFAISSITTQGATTYVDQISIASAAAATVTGPYASLTSGQRVFDTVGSPLVIADGNLFYDPVSNAYYLYADDFGVDNDLGAEQFSSFYPWVPKVAGIACYRSYDLMNWTPVNNGTDAVGKCFTNVVQSGWTVAYTQLWRAQCLYVPGNSAGSRYCLWVHVENQTGTLFKIAVFTGATPIGPFTPSAPFFPVTSGTQDFSLFTDPIGGNTYGVFSVPGGNVTIGQIASNGQSVTGSPTDTGITSIDYPVIFHTGSTYYLLTNEFSILTTKLNALYTATSPTGSYTAAGFNLFDASGPEPYAISYRSQSSSVFVTNSGQIVYLGTRWAWQNMGASPPVFAPINTSGANPVITYASSVGFTPSGALTPPTTIRPWWTYATQQVIGGP